MNRKDFLKMTARVAAAGCAAVSAGLCAPALAAEIASEEKNNSQSLSKANGLSPKRVSRSYAGFVSAAPEKVFPLLCPVREYEWLEGWKCKMIYSESGVAEENCVFETDFGEGPMAWIVSRYEPPRKIEFVISLPERRIERLNIVLRPQNDGTEIRWERISTKLNEAGGVPRWDSDLDRILTEKLDYFLRTGAMMRQ
jgi:hypothetical protein